MNELSQSLKAYRETELPKGIKTLHMLSGRVVARVTSRAFKKGLSLRLGQDEVRLQPLTPADLDTLKLSVEYRPASDDETPLYTDDKATVLLNDLKDWTMSDADTYQLQITDHQADQTVAVTSLTLPPHKRAWTFCANLGVHRGDGTLMITVAQQDDKDGSAGDAEQTVFEVPFDAEFSGGQNPEKYQHVEIELPASALPSQVSIAVCCSGLEGAPLDLDPFFFVADPHVRRPIGTSAAADGDTTHLPEHGPVWCGADVPALMNSGDELLLVSPDGTYPLKTASRGTIEMVEDQGHTIVLRASEPGVYRIFVDGKFAFASHIGTGATHLRFPSEIQTGHVRRISVFDEHQVQEFFSTFILLPRLLTPVDVLQKESRAPYPAALMPQAVHRYAALKSAVAAGGSPAELAQKAYALSVLEGGHQNVKLKPLKFARPKKPDVSIVIPAHNKVEVTYLALCSLLLAHNESSFEVIVVDDASDDETATLEDLVEGITVIHNAQSQRFIRACNAGVAEATGTYVVLLNNDVEVTNGWLDALVDAFGRFDNVGLVGSKLLYPDGKLQDAGGIIWKTGNPWNYGNRQNPWDPRFCYARQADYLSGAAMMTTREIWNEVGGLSSYLEPMYFEDTDFAFKVRDAGYKTWFVPSSIVYHFEGMTSGTDTSTGFKRYQEVNRPKFKRRWAAAYASHGIEAQTPDLEKDRGVIGRVLFIDYATPRPDRDAGSYAAIQEMKLVQSLGYKVSFLPRNLAHLGEYTDELERMGVEVIYAPFFLSIEQYLEAHARDFDAFYITRYYVARDVLDMLKTHAPDRKVIFNNADLHFLRELRAGTAAGDQARIEAARSTRELELGVMERVDVVLSYNDTEHSVIESHTDGRVTLAKCPWIVDLPQTVPDLKARSGLSFLGNYDHMPNAEGVEWFVRQVMPALETDHPDLRLHIYGSAMPDTIKALETDQILPLGFIEEVADAYDQHRIFVAPLLSGAGIKGKVLAALAHGIPCVLTPVAAEGIGLRHAHDCMIARTPEEWVKAIDTLVRSDKDWKKISDNARAYVRETFSFEVGRQMMRDAFEAADLYSPLQ